MLRSFRNLTVLGVKGQPTPGASPLRTPRQDGGAEEEKERCTAGKMRYQRYQFKEPVRALVIRNVT